MKKKPLKKPYVIYLSETLLEDCSGVSFAGTIGRAWGPPQRQEDSVAWGAQEQGWLGHKSTDR